MIAPRFLTFWAINAALDERRMCRQLDEMRALGFDGAVFHPRYYPDKPAYLGADYFGILSKVILHAKSIGMDFWIYDENGWPSGTVGGELLKQHPADAQQWLDVVKGKSSAAVSSFVRDGQDWHFHMRRGQGIDYLNPQATEHFVAMAYARYRDGLTAAAFEHVSTFFSDEPEFGIAHAYDSLSPHGAIPWTPRLPDLYAQRWSRDLLKDLPLLVLAGEGHREFRVRFWELLTDLFCESFIGPLNEWCRRNGKRFTAHVKGEEHPLFQISTSGSCHQVFQHIALPAIDSLERFPSGHFFPRQVVSAAQQFGNGESMVEGFGGAGWGASPEDLQRYLEWLIGHGITHHVLHLWQYRLNTRAIQDWPPSFPNHVNWREAMPAIIERIKRHASLPQATPATLIVAPYRGIMAEVQPWEFIQTNIHNASTYPDTPAARLNRRFLQSLDRFHESREAYHLSDERSIEQHGRIENGQLRLGHCTYRRIILADGAEFGAPGKEILSTLAEKAGSLESASEHFLKPGKQKLEINSFAAFKIDWEVDGPIENNFVLESSPVGEESFAARFGISMPMDAKIWFADEVRAVTFNGMELEIHPQEEGCLCLILRKDMREINDLRFVCATETHTPFLSLQGSFLVRNHAEWTSGPNGTLVTDGPFRAEPFSNHIGSDLLAGGLPFYRGPLMLRGKFELDQEIKTGKLRLKYVAADCTRVSMDGVDLGWTWGPDWSVPLPKGLGAGPKVIGLQLIPSTYNFFGPHHHFEGDRPLVSPDQFRGQKNFADLPHAPSCTHVARWHFKPLRMPSGIEFASGEAIIPND
jgi:hypothetical protein